MSLRMAGIRACSLFPVCDSFLFLRFHPLKDSSSKIKLLRFIHSHPKGVFYCLYSCFGCCLFISGYDFYFHIISLNLISVTVLLVLTKLFLSVLLFWWSALWFPVLFWRFFPFFILLDCLPRPLQLILLCVILVFLATCRNSTSRRHGKLWLVGFTSCSCGTNMEQNEDTCPHP